jgi:hypothetical protein
MTEKQEHIGKFVSTQFPADSRPESSLFEYPIAVLI